MELSLKKIAAAAATTLICATAYASSPYDGVYSCTVNVPAISQEFSGYEVVITNSAGVTGASWLAPVLTAQQIFGYSFGTINGSTYTGTSGINGKTVTIQLNGSPFNSFFVVNGVQYPATFTCARIFGP